MEELTALSVEQGCRIRAFGSCYGGFFFPSKSQTGAASCESVSPGGDTVVPNQAQLLEAADLMRMVS